MRTLTRLVNTRCSNRHNSPLSTVSILQQFLTPERLYFFTPATSLRQSESSSPFQRFPTPERLFFFTPATSLRQSESSSPLQRFLTPERIFFFTPATSLRQSESSSPLQRFLTPERIFFSSVFALQKFLLSSLFLVVWMMPSPYSPSSFTLQCPDCSGIFLPDAFLSRFHGTHFSQVSS